MVHETLVQNNGAARLHHAALIHPALFHIRHAASPQAQDFRRRNPSVTHILPQKDNIPRQITSGNILRHIRELPPDFRDQSIRKIFIGIHTHHPLSRTGKILQRPLELLRLVDIWMLNDMRSLCFGQFTGPVGGKAVDNENLPCNPADIPNAPDNVPFLIERKNDCRNLRNRN